MDPVALHKKFGRLFPTGTVLFREGEEGNDMYIIQSGKVQISRHTGGKEVVLATLPAGEFFGEMSIINNRARSATATVIEEAVLLVIGAKTFEAMICGSAEIAIRMIKKLADRLEQSNRQLEILLYREPNHRVVHFLRGEAQSCGIPDTAGTAIPITESELAKRVGLPFEEVHQVVDRLMRARLLTRGADSGNLIVSEMLKLQEFLDFLELKEKFRAEQQ